MKIAIDIDNVLGSTFHDLFDDFTRYMGKRLEPHEVDKGLDNVINVAATESSRARRQKLLCGSNNKRGRERRHHDSSKKDFLLSFHST